MDITIYQAYLPHDDPTEQLYGVRDCAFRDPAGNMVRIQERR